jgi:hypothetical protein
MCLLALMRECMQVLKLKDDDVSNKSLCSRLCVARELLC